jgi:homogentisate 1,2-dioxygenase
MKSFVHWNKGRTPRQAHRDLGDLKDDELGRMGFYGRTAQLYRKHDPTSFEPRGDYRPREAHVDSLEPSDRHDPRGMPLVLFENADCRVLLSRRTAPMPFHFRTVDGDEAYFVHRGSGRIETEFGSLEYEPGDWLVLPKAITYRVEPDATDNVFLVVESALELQVPDYGLLGRHAPFDPTLVVVPEPSAGDTDSERENGEWEVVIRHGGQTSTIVYPHDPCDVVGWKGDLFPFKLNIRDWNPISAEGIHLPPTVHQFLANDEVMVCHFLPRPAEMRPGAERVPCYHRNADFDEIALFHGGTFLGIDLPAGLITHAPQGLHHGAPEKVREHARRTHGTIDRVDWQIIAIDTRRPLRPSHAVRAFDHARHAPR